MSDHLRLVADNTTGKLVPGPGFKPRLTSPQDYVQSFVFLETDGVMTIIHNGKEVSSLAAVDAMAGVAAYLYRCGRGAKAAAPIPAREPTIYDDLLLDMRRAPRPGEVCAEIYGDGA